MTVATIINRGHSVPSEIIATNGHGHYPPPEPAANPDAQSPMAMLDDRLRGRWRIAIALGIVLGLAFAVAGYRLAPVRYTSVGSIHVAPSGSPILRETPETGTMPRYEGMVATQAVLVKSQRVVDYALQNDEDLKALPISRHPNAREAITGDLTSAPVRGAELIAVSYESDSPSEAQTVLNAILKSYFQLHGEGSLVKRSSRLERLREERRGVELERTLIQQQITDLTSKGIMSASMAQQAMQGKLAFLEKLKEDIVRLGLELGTMEAAVGATASSSRAPNLELVDPELRELRKQRDRVQLELEDLAQRFLNRNSPVYIQKERELNLLIKQVAAKEQAAQRDLDGSNGTWLDPRLQSIEQLRGERDRCIGVSHEVEQELNQLVNEAGQMDMLHADLAEKKKELTEFEDKIRIAEIESDALLAGTITITEEGARPSSPSRDRRMQMAAAGFVGGLGVSFAIFLLLGSVDRRTYSVSQLRRSISKYRCLGVLPDLGQGHLDHETSETAVQCVHQIRNRIEALRDPLPSFMLVVTSPYQGDGKTSLSMALGWSYAAAGYRTLLMDCDLLGHSLSRQLGLLKREGLREVLRDRRLDTQITALPVPNLHALGVGLDASIGPESIRRDDFGTLCGELRRQFDVIIADTGPLIGSIEVLPVAAAADSVVFSIRRGRSRGRLDDCIRELALSQIPYLGIVLNCAVRSDCVRYVSKSTVSARLLPEGTPNGGQQSTAPESTLDNNALIRAMEHMGGEPKSAANGRRAAS